MHILNSLGLKRERKCRNKMDNQNFLRLKKRNGREKLDGYSKFFKTEKRDNRWIL